MKKITSFILLFVLFFTLVSCDTDNSGEDGQEQIPVYEPLGGQIMTLSIGETGTFPEGFTYSTIDTDVIELSENSRLLSVLPKSFIINSFHHQKIGKLGEGLVCEGVSKGAIELITHNQYPLIATQYHIEQLDDSNTEATMKYFISLINGKK